LCRNVYWLFKVNCKVEVESNLLLAIWRLELAPKFLPIFKKWNGILSCSLQWNIFGRAFNHAKPFWSRNIRSYLNISEKTLNWQNILIINLSKYWKVWSLNYLSERNKGFLNFQLKKQFRVEILESFQGPEGNGFQL